jgi:uncharacterized membrane protein YhaH (DUF805 family)
MKVKEIINKYSKNIIGRRLYLLGQFGTLTIIIIGMAPGIFLVLLGLENQYNIISMISFIASIVIASYINIKLIIKRGHDLEWPGLFSVLFYMSGFLLFGIPNLYLLLKEGRKDNTRYSS